MLKRSARIKQCVPHLLGAKNIIQIQNDNNNWQNA